MSTAQYTIAHVLPWPTVGGTEHATLRIAQAVEGAEFKSICFYLKGATAVKDLFAEAGFETVEYQAVEPSLTRPKNYLQESYRRSRIFKRLGIDLVHCSDVLAAHYASLSGWMSGTPVLCHVRNRFDTISRRDRVFLRPVDKFVFVSRDTWKHFAQEVPEQRGLVVYDGLDVGQTLAKDMRAKIRSDFNLSERAKVIGMVARVAPQKDYLTLIKAAARVVAAEPNVKFLIVGDYEYGEVNRKHYQEVRQMLSEHEMTPYFVFTGFREDVPALINAMDVFVLSTHHEGLPLVLLEGMAQAKPIVATAVDGVPEIIIDGKTGLLHDHQNDEQLAHRLLALLQDEALAANLSQAGWHHVKDNFTKERFARNMANLYREMLGDKQKAENDTASVNQPLNQLEGN